MWLTSILRFLSLMQIKGSRVAFKCLEKTWENLNQPKLSEKLQSWLFARNSIDSFNVLSGYSFAISSPPQSLASPSIWCPFDTLDTSWFFLFSLKVFSISWPKLMSEPVVAFVMHFSERQLLAQAMILCYTKIMQYWMFTTIIIIQIQK